MNRRQRAVLLFGLLLIGAAVLGRAQQANAAQAREESAATLESGKLPTEDFDPAEAFPLLLHSIDEAMGGR